MIAVSIIASVMLLALIVRFVQPELIYSLRSATNGVRAGRLFLEESKSAVHSENFARLLVRDRRYESRTSNVSTGRLTKIRELYKMAHHDQNPRAIPEACIVELSDMLRTLGRRIEVSSGPDPDPTPANVILELLAREVSARRGLGAVPNDALELGEWYMKHPISLEQAIELILASVVALNIRDHCVS